MTRYAADGSEIKYGLPEEIKFCQRCVISNQRPNSAIEFAHTKETPKTTIAFNEAGVCDACLYMEKKQTHINWKEREAALVDVCQQYCSHGKAYDCIVPGSGGKDSFYTAHILKYQYGMTPLTITWAPHIYTTWGWENFERWIHAGFDNQLFTPNGRIHRLLTRLALENLFHPFQPFIFGQKAFAPKVAIEQKIPLVLYGENEAEYGNPIGNNDEATRNWDYFSQGDFDKIFMSGLPISTLLETYGLKKADLIPYLPADPHRLRENKVSVHYLGYYLPWHPQSAYYYSVEHGGFQPAPERTPGTYSKYNSIDDRIDDFHYYTTLIKFGIGRATYDASQEIRHGDITRDEGVALVKKFDCEFPERFADEIYQYLSIDKQHFPEAYQALEHPEMTSHYFHQLADTFRSPHLWKKIANEWQLKKAVWMSS